MKILVCGSRDWCREDPIRRELVKFPRGTILVNGYAHGADRIADKIAQQLGFVVRRYPITQAQWDELGKAAGHERNARMLEKEHPDENGIFIDKGLAFSEYMPIIKGTKDMVERLSAAKIPPEVFYR